MDIKVSRYGHSPQSTAPVLANGENLTREDELSISLVESWLDGGKPRQRTVRDLGTLRESAVHDLAEQTRFWESAERVFDELGFPVGSEVGEQLRATLAIHVNPPGPARRQPLRIEDAEDPAFLQLLERVANGGDGLYRDTFETSEQLARHQGDDVRLAHVLRHRNRFPDEIKTELVLEAWKEARHPSRFDPGEIVNALGELGDSKFKEGRRPEEPIRVYRAVDSEGIVRGIAWTTVPSETGIFSSRALKKSDDAPVRRPARVYSATINPQGMLATHGFECEIMVDSAYLTDVRLERLIWSEEEAYDWPKG